jgi:hypothetical protein
MIPEQITSLLLTLFAGLGGVALVLFLTWIFFPERIEKWAILLHKLLAYVSEKHERRYIEKHIENGINSWRKRACKECDGVLPYEFKLKWANVDAVESELNEGKLIVKMKNHRNQSKNFAIAVREYVPNTLIPKARRYVQPLIADGINHVVSKSILCDDTRALSYFADMSSGEFTSKPDLKKTIEELDIIHGQGKLTRILLSEYNALSKLHPSDPSEEIHRETADFEKLVFNFVMKKPEEDVDLNFNRANLQVAIVAVAKSSKLFTFGLQPYLSFVERMMKEGIPKFYITAASGMIPHARELCEKAVTDLGLRKVNEDEYEGIYRKKRTKLYCAFLKKPDSDV